MTPKNIHKILIPKNIHFSENPKKYWNSKFWTPKNDPSLYENIRVTPLGVCQIMTPYIIIPSTFDEVSHAIKKKAVAISK